MSFFLLLIFFTYNLSSWNISSGVLQRSYFLGFFFVVAYSIIFTLFFSCFIKSALPKKWFYDLLLTFFFFFFFEPWNFVLPKNVCNVFFLSFTFLMMTFCCLDAVVNFRALKRAFALPNWIKTCSLILYLNFGYVLMPKIFLHLSWKHWNIYFYTQNFIYGFIFF